MEISHKKAIGTETAVESGVTQRANSDVSTAKSQGICPALAQKAIVFPLPEDKEPVVVVVAATDPKAIVQEGMDMAGAQVDKDKDLITGKVVTSMTWKRHMTLL